MTDAYILKEVEAVTTIAKNIFGDIVHKVYYAEVHYDHREESQTISMIDRQITSACNSEKSIDQDAKTIIIEFTNGRKVVFSNSEWGSMEAFSDDEYKKIV